MPSKPFASWNARLFASMFLPRNICRPLRTVGLGNGAGVVSDNTGVDVSECCRFFDFLTAFAVTSSLSEDADETGSSGAGLDLRFETDVERDVEREASSSSADVA